MGHSGTGSVCLVCWSLSSRPERPTRRSARVKIDDLILGQFLGACRKSNAFWKSIRLYTMNLLRSDRLLAIQIFSTVQELPGELAGELAESNSCSFGQLPPSSQTALGARRNTPARS